jgi:hypothetical protein
LPAAGLLGLAGLLSSLAVPGGVDFFLAKGSNLGAPWTVLLAKSVNFMLIKTEILS